MIRLSALLLLGLFFFSGHSDDPVGTPYIMVLGTAQDAGYPQIGCTKECCELVHSGEEPSRYPASLALIDPTEMKWYLIEASPAINAQIRLFNDSHPEYPTLPEAIFITHAHMGHYTGLMHLGREALGADSIRVYAMPRLRSFLSSNGPWDQLVRLGNIRLMPLDTLESVQLSVRVSVSALEVPHRDEYSETVGFQFRLGQKKALFIPDIDKWTKWNHSIQEVVKQVDLAFLDATFYSQEELPNRDMSEIPHPFVMESYALFDPLHADQKRRIHFIHMNHSNPLLWDDSTRARNKKKGYQVAIQGSDYLR